MSRRKVLIDIGSTYTKVVVVDIESGSLLATGKSPTTATTDVCAGIGRALESVGENLADTAATAHRLACSSAAGGLRMVAIGLVPELSSEAAKRAALGAGAKIVAQYSHRLTNREMRAFGESRPDIVLLSGGTDGGNEKAILHNARVLADSGLRIPIVVAGNKDATDEIERLFDGAALDYRLVDNVMPELGRLEVGPCREAIREVFIDRIVRAKGLDEARELIGGVVMATPAAVLKAATLLARGCASEAGLGDLVAIDVGGATTDVYSISDGLPTGRAVRLRGLPEPYAKRTVEGDLGVRHNIDTLHEIADSRRVTLDNAAVAAFRAEASRLPRTDAERATDSALARLAAEVSFERHVGSVHTVYGPSGELLVQTGKDLRDVATVIGTGGPILHCTDPVAVLASALENGSRPELLKPRCADLLLDDHYLLFAMGLLADSHPQAALHIMKSSLARIAKNHALCDDA